MRSSEEIKRRAKELLNQELERRVAEAQSQVPHNCVHNIRQPLDTRRTVGGEPNPAYNRITAGRGLPVVQTIGLCGIGVEDPRVWQMNICDEPIDALRCPVFQSNRERQQIVSEFEALVKDDSWLREHLPEIYSLLWALSGDTLTPKLPEEEEEISPVEIPVTVEEEPVLTWWDKFLSKFRGLKKSEAVKLLPKSLN